MNARGAASARVVQAATTYARLHAETLDRPVVAFRELMCGVEFDVHLVTGDRLSGIVRGVDDVALLVGLQVVPWSAIVWAEPAA